MKVCSSWGIGTKSVFLAFRDDPLVMAVVMLMAMAVTVTIDNGCGYGCGLVQPQWILASLPAKHLP